MIISNGLQKFVNRAIMKSKRERFLGFLSKSKNHAKFAKALDHELIAIMDKSLFREPIDINASKEVGYLYCSNGVSSDRETPIAELYGKAPWEGGWLIVNSTGNFAIYRPEGKIDDEVFIEL